LLGSFRWRDALCINQKDAEEKVQQISQIGDIYRLADRVYAWLGENVENEDGGIHKIMGMARCVGMDWLAWKAYLIRRFDSSADSHDTFARGIVNLSTRPWVSRLWVIQEVVLASKSPIILACQASSFDSLQELVIIIATYPKRIPNHISKWERIFQLGLLSLMKIDYQRDEDNQGIFDLNSSNSAARLNKILGFTKGHHATLPHDYIYGLLGLARREAPPPLLTPDYNRPYPQVCQEYARFIFENTGDLSVLLHSNSEISGVRSWVPDVRPNIYWAPEYTEKNLSPLSFSDGGNRMTLLALELGSCLHVWVPRQKWSFTRIPKQVLIWNSIYYPRFIFSTVS